jgi:hypothetical protein
MPVMVAGDAYLITSSARMWSTNDPRKQHNFIFQNISLANMVNMTTMPLADPIFVPCARYRKSVKSCTVWNVLVLQEKLQNTRQRASPML